MKRSPFSIKCLILTGLVAAQMTSSSAYAQVQRSVGTLTEAKFDATVQNLEARGFRGVIAIAPKDGKTFYAGFGDTATKSGKPNKDTLVDTGSITKTITAIAALTLVDDAKLSTADRLSDFFPDAPDDKASITLHQLLTHSAGFPGAVGDDHEGLSKDAFLERAMNVDLLFQPGSNYEYSNVGYSLVAAIIEQVSGKDYERFIREDVLGRRCNRDIGYESAYEPKRSLLTASGADIKTASWGGSSHWALIGNGGLVSSAKDMVCFRRAVIDGDIISPAAIQLAQTPMVREGEGAPSHYGYGMVVEDHPNFGRVYWHNGGNGHFLANWTHYADHGFIVFTASNSPDFDADLAGLAIAETLFDLKILPDLKTD